MHLRYVRDQETKKKDVLDSHLFTGTTWEGWRKKLARWRRTQRRKMPEILHLLPEIDDESFGEDELEPDEDGVVTLDILALPSDFSREERNEYELEELARYELILRIGQAFDQLELVRRAVQHRAAHIDSKKKNARGNKANNAAEKEIQDATKLARLLATRYNANFESITVLRAADYNDHEDTSPGARLRRIDLDKDLEIANLAAVRSLGDSKRTGSWIWEVFYSQDAVAGPAEDGVTTRSGMVAAQTSKYDTMVACT